MRLRLHAQLAQVTLETDWVGIIGAVAAVVSAVPVVVGATYWWLKRTERAERAEREKQVSRDVAEMGDALETVQQTIHALAEEARGRRPQLSVRFAIPGEEPSPTVRIVKRAVPVVDVEGIVDSERQAALASLPRAETSLPSPRSRHRLDLGVLSALVAAAAGGKYLPVTAADRKAYAEDVEQYLSRVRGFIPRWLAFLEARRQVVSLEVRIDNDGGAPAERVRVRLKFPDPCCRRDFPKKPERPQRPKFTPRLNPALRSPYAGLSLALPHVARLPPSSPRERFHGPFYEDGSLGVVFEYDELPHHDPLTTDVFDVGVPEPGVFNVHWSVGAANLARPESGVLVLEVVHEEAPTHPATSLASLLDAARPAA